MTAIKAFGIAKHLSDKPLLCPAGFNIVDVLALGSLGHVVGVGIIMGLKGTGNL